MAYPGKPVQARASTATPPPQPPVRRAKPQLNHSRLHSLQNVVRSQAFSRKCREYCDGTRCCWPNRRYCAWVRCELRDLNRATITIRQISILGGLLASRRWPLCSIYSVDITIYVRQRIVHPEIRRFLPTTTGLLREQLKQRLHRVPLQISRNCSDNCDRTRCWPNRR